MKAPLKDLIAHGGLSEVEQEALQDPVDMSDLYAAVGYPRCVKYIHLFPENEWFPWLKDMLKKGVKGDEELNEIVNFLRPPAISSIHERWELSWTALKIARRSLNNGDRGRYKMAKMVADGCWMSAMTVIINDEEGFRGHFTPQRNIRGDFRG